VETNHKHLFLSQKVDTAHRFLHLQTFLHLTRLNIPEPDRFIVASTDQAFTTEEESGTEVGVTVEEPNALWEGVAEVGFAVVERAIKRVPDQRLVSESWGINSGNRCTYQPSGLAGGWTGDGSCSVIFRQWYCQRAGCCTIACHFRDT